MTGGTFYELLQVSHERFDFCKTGTFHAREKRGGISWASFLLSEGGNIQDLQATLKDTIEHFNANFQKVGKMDDELVHNFNILAKVVSGIEGQGRLTRIGNRNATSRSKNVFHGVENPTFYSFEYYPTRFSLPRKHRFIGASFI